MYLVIYFVIPTAAEESSLSTKSDLSTVVEMTGR